MAPFGFFWNLIIKKNITKIIFPFFEIYFSKDIYNIKSEVNY